MVEKHKTKQMLPHAQIVYLLYIHGIQGVGLHHWKHSDQPERVLGKANLCKMFKNSNLGNLPLTLAVFGLFCSV